MEIALTEQLLPCYLRVGPFCCILRPSPKHEVCKSCPYISTVGSKTIPYLPHVVKLEQCSGVKTPSPKYQGGKLAVEDLQKLGITYRNISS
jgi:hypothetical protein